MKTQSIKSVLGFAGAMALAAGALMAPSPAAKAATLIQVDVELALLMDVSGSVSANQYDLQVTGYANAFRNPAVHNAITGGSFGSIAVSAMQFDNSTYMAIPWAQITSSADSIAFADMLDNMTRLGSGFTGIGQGMQFATNSMLNNDFDGVRLVIDVSGDGRNNTGIDPATARDQALAAGVTTINAIAIDDPSGNLRQYFEDEVIGGPDAFAREAATFEDFESELLEKLLAEITGGPPATYPVLATLHSAAVSMTQTATHDVAGRLLAIRTGVPDAVRTHVGPPPPPQVSAKGGLSAKVPAVAPTLVHRQWEVFGSLFYVDQDTDAQTRLMGTGAPVTVFPATEVEIFGGTVGIERRIAPVWTAGLAFTASTADVTVRGFSTSDVDAYFITPYVSYYRKDAFPGADFYADLLYAYGRHDYKINRISGGGVATGSPDGNTHSLEFTTGVNFRAGDVLHGPFAALHWLDGDIDGYTETGPGAMVVAGSDFESLASRLGYLASVRVPVQGGTLVPFGLLAWEHEFEDNQALVGGMPISIMDEDSLVVGAGMGAYFNNGWTVRGEYEGRFGSDTTRHFLGIRAGFQF